MFDLRDELNATSQTAGFLSYAHDFVICAKEDDANEVWKKGERRLLRLAPRSTRRSRSAGGPEGVVPGTQVTDRNLMKADEEDATLAKGRNVESCILSARADRTARILADSRKVEALWLLTLTSIARVVKLEKIYEMAQELAKRTKTRCEVLVDGALDESETTHGDGDTVWCDPGGRGLRCDDAKDRRTARCDAVTDGNRKRQTCRRGLPRDELRRRSEAGTNWTKGTCFRARQG